MTMRLKGPRHKYQEVAATAHHTIKEPRSKKNTLKNVAKEKISLESSLANRQGKYSVSILTDGNLWMIKPSPRQPRVFVKLRMLRMPSLDTVGTVRPMTQSVSTWCPEGGRTADAYQ